MMSGQAKRNMCKQIFLSFDCFSNRGFNTNDNLNTGMGISYTCIPLWYGFCMTTKCHKSGRITARQVRHHQRRHAPAMMTSNAHRCPHTQGNQRTSTLQMYFLYRQLPSALEQRRNPTVKPCTCKDINTSTLWGGGGGGGGKVHVADANTMVQDHINGHKDI